MHPINPRHFGVGKLYVLYYNGTTAVSGYIVKQVGDNRYLVTDGTTPLTIKLAQTTNLAQMLTGEITLVGASVVGLGTITITVTGTNRYVKKLGSKLATCTDGNVYPWSPDSVLPSGAYAISIYRPVNTALPTISGTAQVAHALTASTGTWTRFPASYTYQWNAAGVIIAGATNSSYTPVSGDIGKIITVTVNAVKAGTTPVAVTSAATAAVIA